MSGSGSDGSDVNVVWDLAAGMPSDANRRSAKRGKAAARRAAKSRRQAA